MTKIPRYRGLTVPPLVLGLVLAGAVLAGPASARVGPAPAAVLGLELVSGPSPTNPVDSKGGSATCPIGKQVLGGGAEIAGGFGEVLIASLTPQTASGVPFVRANGAEIDPITNNWSIKAFAICAKPVPGLERIAAFSTLDSAPKTAVATCPGSKKLIGLGGDIAGPQGKVVMDGLTPNATLTSVTVTGFEVEATSETWRLTAFSICADPLPGLQLVTTASNFDSVANKSAGAGCPSGKQLLGVGGQFNGSVGQVVMNNLTPDAALKSVTVTGIEEDPTPAKWSVRAFGICATP